MDNNSLSRRDLIKGSVVAATAQQPDLTLINGKILTLDDRNTVATAVAIRNGRIAEIGSSVGKSARTIDLKGATVIPGLIDAHSHIYWAFRNPGPEVRDIELARSMKEFLQAISDRARTVPAGQFLCCNGGWTRDSLQEKRLPTLAELDAAAPRHPVWLSETQSEAAWIDPSTAELSPALTNSRGLAFFRTHGVMVDAAQGTVPWTQSVELLRKQQSDAQRLDDAIDYGVRHGLTMTHEFISLTNPPATTLVDEFPYLVDLWRAQKLRLRMRLRLYATDIDVLRSRMVNNVNRLGDDVLRLNGFGEAISPDYGASFAPAAKLIAERGWSAHVHSVGEEENQAHIAGYRQAHAVRSLQGLRWSLAHVNGITPQQLQTLKAMDAGVTAEGAYGWADPSPGAGAPWRLLVDSGIHVGAGSDGTGTSGWNPWLTLYYLSTGRNIAGALTNPGQTLSRIEALKVHTRGSAWHSFDDHHLGTLEAGKLADLAVLSDDALTVPDDKLRLLTSTLTLRAGKVVHRSA